MARPLRIEYPGALYHLTGRGNAKQMIYVDDVDRQRFLEILYEAKKKYNCLCHAYCLMGNHYHLLIETVDGRLSMFMRHLNGVYTQYFNRRHKRTGHLFQGRYKGILIENESHLLEVCRYVVLNPLRSKMVSQLLEWQWSSYPGTAGLGEVGPWLDVEWVRGCFGKKTGKALKHYRKFVHEGIGKDDLWKAVKGQCILGTEDFVEQMAEYVKGHAEIPEINRSQKYLNRPELKKLFSDKVTRDRSLRDKTVVKAVFEYGYKQREVADYLGLHFGSVSRIIRLSKKNVKKIDLTP